MTPSTGTVDHATRCAQADSDVLLRDMLTTIGDKWTVLVIGHLHAGPLRFTRLLDQIPAISHRMLTRTLRNLERDGIVRRSVYPESPPRVEYALTPLGHTLIVPLSQLHAWVLEHRDEVTENRVAHDGASSES